MKILKQILLAILILCTTSFAMGQSYIDKGAMNISGSVSFNSSKNEDSDITQTSFNIQPGLFYSLNRYLALGGQLGYSSGTTKEGNSKETRSLIELSPGVKISYPLQGNLIPFFKALYSYHKSLSGDPEYKMSTILLAAGFDFFINKHVALMPQLAYRMASSTNEHGDPVGTVETNTNYLTASIGISVFINN